MAATPIFMTPIRLDNVLITGAHGMVGSYIDFGIRTGKDDLDVTDADAVRRWCAEHTPRAIVHLAAETDLAACEKDPGHAYLSNAAAAYYLALAARDLGIKMIYLSTSAVFDGTKEGPYETSDAPSPQGVYAHSKYLGELAVRGLAPDHCILRSSWMFGGGPGRDRKFVGKILSQLTNPTITIVSGRRGSPTYAKDLARGIRTALENDMRGVVHMANAGSPTRAEVAAEIVHIAEAPARIIESAGVPDASTRGGGNESMASVSGMRPWQDALREYLETEWGSVLNRP